MTTFSTNLQKDRYTTNFSNVNTVTGYNNVTCWDGTATAWSKMNAGVAAGGISLASSGSTLYVVSGNDGNVYVWSGSPSATSTWTTYSTSSTQLFAIANVGGTIYAGGVGGVGGVWKFDGSATWTSVGTGATGDIYSLAGSSMLYRGGLKGISALSSNVVAKVTGMSASSNSAGVQLAYISRTDSMPYYVNWNGTSWESPVQLGYSALAGQIALSTSADGSTWLVAWDRAGQIEYRLYSSAMWGALTTTSTGSNNIFPTLPEVIVNSVVPILWTKSGDTTSPMGVAPIGSMMSSNDISIGSGF